MGELSKLKGLGPKSEKCLNEVGIFTKDDLVKAGAVKIFIQLQNESTNRPSLNFLYALVGAIENRHWADIAKTEKSRLLMELEGYKEMQDLLDLK